MDALLTLAVYLVPFLVIGIAAKHWIGRKGVGLADVRAEGGPGRKRSRFLLGIWRHDDPG
jgi:hypothetical protein